MRLSITKTAPVLIAVLVLLFASGLIYTVSAEDTLTYTDGSNVTFYYTISGSGEDAFAVITGADNSKAEDADGKITIPERVGESEDSMYPVREIGTSAFVSNQNLKVVTVPEGVERIEENCFNNCQKLTSITLPDSLTYIGPGAFMQTSIKEISLPDNIKEIKPNTFFWCYKLEKVELPADLTSIGEYAFYECKRLSDITFPGSLKKVERHAFAQIAIKSVIIPASLTDMGEAVFERCLITDFTVAGGNSKYSSKGGCLYTKDGKTLLQYPLGSKAETYTVPAGTVTIGSQAFRQAEYLRKVTLQSGVTTIAENAFQFSGIEEVIFPDTLKSIGDYAFSECYNLGSTGSVSIPDSVTSIGEFAFQFSGIRSIDIPGSVKTVNDNTFFLCNSLEKVVLNKGTQTIGKEAFSNCPKLRELTIPATVTSIGNNILQDSGTQLGEGESIRIIGYINSAGEAFAKENGLEFVRAVDPVSQKINVTSVLNCTYGSKPFALGAKAMTAMTYSSSNTAVAAVSKTGVVTLTGMGTAVITIRAKETNEYLAAQASVTINVKPARAVIKVKNIKKRKVKITWAKVAGADGYEVYIKSPGKKKYVKRATKKARVKSVTHSGLKKGKTYRYKVRAFKKVNGKKIYGAFSKVKKVKIKK